MTSVTVRPAVSADHDHVLSLATSFAVSFPIRPEAFGSSFEQILGDGNAALFVATDEASRVVGYVLASSHPAFFANGPVVWVEEITVKESRRRGGVGRALMGHVERWGAERHASLIAVATRRAGNFYRACAYEESATYFRKLLEAP